MLYHEIKNYRIRNIVAHIHLESSLGKIPTFNLNHDLKNPDLVKMIESVFEKSKYELMTSAEKDLSVTILTSLEDVSREEIKDFIKGYTEMQVIADPEDIHNLITVFS